MLVSVSGIHTISDCTAIETQMGQVKLNLEGGFATETGIVNRIEPEIMNFDPNKRRGHTKISDYFSLKTHCTHKGPSFKANRDYCESPDEELKKP